MKKTLALFLAVLLVFALIGCGTGTDTEGDTTDATTTDTGSETAAAETEGTAESYQIVYLCPSYTVEWPLGMVTQIAKYEDKYNFELIAADSKNDNETYVNLLETYCDQGVDGFILMTLPDLQQRAYEICRDAGVPMIYDAIAFTDEDGKLMTAGAEMNATDFGEQCCQWIVDNYQTYGGRCRSEHAGLYRRDVFHHEVDDRPRSRCDPGVYRELPGLPKHFYGRSAV